MARSDAALLLPGGAGPLRDFCAFRRAIVCRKSRWTDPPVRDQERQRDSAGPQTERRYPSLAIYRGWGVPGERVFQRSEGLGCEKLAGDRINSRKDRAAWTDLLP